MNAQGDVSLSMTVLIESGDSRVLQTRAVLESTVAVCAVGQWTKVPHTYCKAGTSNFPSLGAAQTACAASSNCSAVIDDACDGINSFKSCKANTLLHYQNASKRSSYESCVYLSKPSGAFMRSGSSQARPVMRYYVRVRFG